MIKFKKLHVKTLPSTTHYINKFRAKKKMSKSLNPKCQVCIHNFTIAARAILNASQNA